MLRLYGRCKAFSKLPCEGGVLEQPVWAMEALDVIQASVDKIMAKRDEEARTEAMKNNLVRNVDGR